MERVVARNNLFIDIRIKARLYDHPGNYLTMTPEKQFTPTHKKHRAEFFINPVDRVHSISFLEDFNQEIVLFPFLDQDIPVVQ